jgi:hypothetical protein
VGLVFFFFGGHEQERLSVKCIKHTVSLANALARCPGKLTNVRSA